MKKKAYVKYDKKHKDWRVYDRDGDIWDTLKTKKAADKKVTQMRKEDNAYDLVRKELPKFITRLTKKTGVKRAYIKEWIIEFEW